MPASWTGSAAAVIAESHYRTRHRSDRTAREHEVLTLLAEGLSNSRIADQLIIDDATV